MKKHDMECTTIRKTPLHVPDTGAHIRQGLSHMFDTPTTREGVTCSPLSGTTCFTALEVIEEFLIALLDCRACQGSYPVQGQT
jgi:hypothetical protein